MELSNINCPFCNKIIYGDKKGYFCVMEDHFYSYLSTSIDGYRQEFLFFRLFLLEITMIFDLDQYRYTIYNPNLRTIDLTGFADINGQSIMDIFNKFKNLQSLL